MTDYDAHGQRKLHPESKWQAAADELRRGADALERDAHNLQGRGNPEDHPAVSARKLAAAADVRALADSIEATPGGMYDSEYQRLHAVAEAARCEGILVDSPVPHRGFAEDDDTFGASLQYWHDRRAGRIAAVEQGDLVRVADPGQVPFFALKSYGGWTEAVIPEPREADSRLHEDQEQARAAANDTVARVAAGESWTAAMQSSGLDKYRELDKWSQGKRFEARAEQPHTRDAAARAEWDAIAEAEIEREQARLEQEQQPVESAGSRNWDRSRESAADKKLHDLRDSGYRGPIDQDGNAVTEGPDAAALKRMAEQRGEDTSWWTGDASDRAAAQDTSEIHPDARGNVVIDGMAAGDDVTIANGPEAGDHTGDTSDAAQDNGEPVPPVAGRTFGGGVQERADGGGVWVRGNSNVVLHGNVFEGDATVVQYSEQVDSSFRVSDADDVMEA